MAREVGAVSSGGLVMKGRLSSTVWMLVGINAVALIGVLALAYNAGKAHTGSDIAGLPMMLIGAAVLVLGTMLQLPTWATAVTAALLCFGLRFIAMRRGWQLPIARPPEQSARTRLLDFRTGWERQTRSGGRTCQRCERNQCRSGIFVEGARDFCGRAGIQIAKNLDRANP